MRLAMRLATRLTRPLLLASLLAAPGCQRARPPVQPIVLGEEAAGRTFQTRSLEEEARQAITRRYTQRERRFREAWEPGSMWRGLRVEQADINSGRVTLPQLVDIGRELFRNDFTPVHGLGNGLGPRKSPLAGGRAAPNLRHIHYKSFGGPDGTRCAGCHHVGGLGGAGFSADNSDLDGDGVHASTGLPRNPRALFGAALIQRLAEEMTAELQAQYLQAKKTIPRGGSMPLLAKGVQFGKLAMSQDGRLDITGVRGVSLDLVVRPFGWKGTTATLRQAVIEGLQQNLGVQAEELVKNPGAMPLGDGPPDDPDADGVVREATEGMVTALVVYLTSLPPPVEEVPTEASFSMRIGRGAKLFSDLGCAGCHTPELPLSDTVISLGPTPTSRPRVDLAPLLSSIEKGQRQAVVRLYSDLRRHNMGEPLKEAHGYRGVPPAQFLTPPLWGISASGPYMHDGRAGSLDAAIRAHAGEAEPAKKAYEKLSMEEGGWLRMFLLSLNQPSHLEFKP